LLKKNNMRLLRTDHNHPDFKVLVEALNHELSVRDGEDHAFYSQFNEIESLGHVVLAYEGDIVVGCGAFKFFDVGMVELKRMYTSPIGRKKGTATHVLKELEVWAKELRNISCVLETGKNLLEAVALYSKSGYHRIPNYDPYLTTDNSVCFEKTLN
tara:strand:- start:2139 stop:2606 length:468 start_codon:yes stop_codon:yes gene_type:complete